MNMNNLDKILCRFCRNSTIISTEKPSNCLFNKSEDEEVQGNPYSICTVCNIYSYINLGTILYNENFSKSHNIINDIKYDPKLITIDEFCKNCGEDQSMKMFASNNFDLKYKLICPKCNTIYDFIR